MQTRGSHEGSQGVNHEITVDGPACCWRIAGLAGARKRPGHDAGTAGAATAAEPRYSGSVPGYDVAVVWRIALHKHAGRQARRGEVQDGPAMQYLFRR